MEQTISKEDMEKLFEAGNENKPKFTLSTNPKKIGETFENLFLSIIKDEGLKENEDFYDLRYLKHRCIGVPDLFFPKSNTFVEIKSGNNGSPIYSNEQKIKIDELKHKGFFIKTIFFNIQIFESSENSLKLMDFINNLKRTKDNKEVN